MWGWVRLRFTIMVEVGCQNETAAQWENMRKPNRIYRVSWFGLVEWAIANVLNSDRMDSYWALNHLQYGWVRIDTQEINPNKSSTVLVLSMVECVRFYELSIHTGWPSKWQKSVDCRSFWNSSNVCRSRSEISLANIDHWWPKSKLLTKKVPNFATQNSDNFGF